MRREELRAAIDRDPDAIVELVMTLSASVAALRVEVDELKRQLGRDSHNSSLPPSRDSPAARAKRPKKGSGRKQGGQPGHPGRHRELLADPDRVIEHWPETCGGCGALIAAGDREAVGDAVCHQVSDIVVRVDVTEHRRMRKRCACGCRTLADLPVGVPAGAFGPSVAAAAATLTAARLSRRDVARLLGDLCGVTISAASVERLVKQAADALEDPYMQIVKAVDASAVRGADETSWRQAGRTTWLSVAVAQTAALFQLDARRDRDAAMALLGERPTGTIVSDRYAVYLYIDDRQRQLCLAHLLRDFVALGERAGAPGRLGRALARVLGDVFTALKQPGRDLDDLGVVRADTAQQRERLHALLAKGARSRDAKTKRFCAGLLAHEDALWTFTRVTGVPATNNAAERALRHAVMWRKISYATQTEHGNRLVDDCSRSAKPAAYNAGACMTT